MRPGPAISSRPCCPSASGSSAPSTAHPDHPRPTLSVDRGGGGCGRGPRSVRGPAAHPRASPRPRAPEHPDHPPPTGLLDRGGGGCGRGPRSVRGPAAHPRASPRPRAPSTLTTRHQLAYWTGEAGDAAAARDQFAALLPIRERVLGPEHPDILTTCANLAHWTGAAGDAAPDAS